MTEPPIQVPSTGFDSKYATISEIKVQDGRAQFQLTLQRDPTKPLVNSPYRMVQDLQALVSEPTSLLYTPPAGYFEESSSFYQSTVPLSPKAAAEESPKPKGLRLMQT